MTKSKRLTDHQGEVRSLLAADFKRAKPADEVLPETVKRKLGVRGPQVAPKKERITIRLSPQVVQTFRATGACWQTRVDSALRDWLSTHEP